jgi:hypothetical protein
LSCAISPQIGFVSVSAWISSLVFVDPALAWGAAVAAFSKADAATYRAGSTIERPPSRFDHPSRKTHTMAKDFGPYVIPDDHAALVGRVADLWAQFEFQIDLGIWRLANTHQQLAACITAQLQSIHPRLKAFGALVAVSGGSEESIKDVSRFQGSISGLAERRNRAIHDPRYRQNSTGDIHRLEITAKPHVQFGFVHEPQSELRAFIETIHGKTREFMALRDRIVAEIDALPSESQPLLHKIKFSQKSTSNQPSGSPK